MAAEIDELEPEWDALADRVDAPPWLRPGWVRAWWRAFGRGRLDVVTVRDGGRLAGVVPLARRAGARVSPTNWHTPEFGLLADSGAARDELAGRVFADRTRSVSLSFVDPGGLRECDEAARRSGYVVHTRTLMRSPYVALAGGWDAYEGSLERKRVKEIARRRRLLEEQGAVTIDEQDGSERLDALLEEGFAVEASGWKAREGTAIVSHPETRAFYRDVAAWAAARGTLRLFFLRLEGRALAFQLHLEEARALHYLKGGYVEEYRRFAPATLLTHEVLARAFARELETYEFLGSDDAYKRDWTSLVRERLRFQAFAPTLAGRVERVAYVHGRPLAKRALALARR